MKLSKSFRWMPFALLLATMSAASMAVSQEAAQEKKFFEVAFGPEEIYKYADLKFTGDFSSIESPSGMLALGRTEVGVTIAIILGPGTVTLETPEAAREKLTQVFGAHPLKAAFKTLYMRLSPKEFEETLGKMSLEKAADEKAFEAAKQIYADRFLTSYHAGDKALLPPYKTRVMDIESVDFGTITYEEGYWIRLRRVSPYASIYPRDFINPKQK
jgi:hypothetical protein